MGRSRIAAQLIKNAGTVRVDTSKIGSNRLLKEISNLSPSLPPTAASQLSFAEQNLITTHTKQKIPDRSFRFSTNPAPDVWDSLMARAINLLPELGPRGLLQFLYAFYRAAVPDTSGFLEQVKPLNEVVFAKNKYLEAEPFCVHLGLHLRDTFRINTEIMELPIFVDFRHQNTNIPLYCKIINELGKQKEHLIPSDICILLDSLKKLNKIFASVFETETEAVCVNNLNSICSEGFFWTLISAVSNQIMLCPPAEFPKLLLSLIYFQNRLMSGSDGIFLLKRCVEYLRTNKMQINGNGLARCAIELLKLNDHTSRVYKTNDIVYRRCRMHSFQQALLSNSSAQLTLPRTLERTGECDGYFSVDYIKATTESTSFIDDLAHEISFRCQDICFWYIYEFMDLCVNAGFVNFRALEGMSCHLIQRLHQASPFIIANVAGMIVRGFANSINTSNLVHSKKLSALLGAIVEEINSRVCSFSDMDLKNIDDCFRLHLSEISAEYSLARLKDTRKREVRINL